VRRWLRSLAAGLGHLTLDPSPRLRRLREQAQRARAAAGPLPPLPAAAYTPEGALMEPQDWPACRDGAASGREWPGHG